MTQHPAAPPPPGISGKRVTLWLVGGLAVIVVVLSYALWTYNRLDAQRARTARAWRSALESLAERYQVAEKRLQDSVASGETNAAFGQKFQADVDTFRTTSIVSEQIAAAERIEDLLGSDPFPRRAGPPLPRTAQLQNEIDEYNQLRENERALLNSLGGKFLNIFIEFPSSQPFRLTPEKK